MEQQSSEKAGVDSETYDTGYHTHIAVQADEDTGGRTSAKWAAEAGDQKAWREPGGPNDKSAASGETGRRGASAGPGLSTKGGGGSEQPGKEHSCKQFALSKRSKWNAEHFSIQ